MKHLGRALYLAAPWVVMLALGAVGQIVTSLPFTLLNGTVADATQVMANFNQIVANVNANGAKNGANTDITSLSGLTTALTPAQGGSAHYVGGTSTGSANAHVVASTTPTSFALTAGNRLTFIAGFTNTTATTLNAGGSGVKNVFRVTRTGAAALVGGEIIAGQQVTVSYDGTQYQLMSNNADAALYDASGNQTIPGTLTVTGVSTLTGVSTQQSTSHGTIAAGTTAQRPGSPAVANFRYNSTLGQIEFYDGAAWQQPSLAQPVAAGYKNLLVQNNSGTPDTRIDLTADAVTVETTAGVAYRLRAVSVTINGSTTGANALDTGALAASTWYSVWVIYNPTTAVTAGLISLSDTTPTMPSGFTAKARFSWNRTDGSTHFHRVRQMGNRAQYVVGSGTPTTAAPNIANGAAGTYSNTAPTYATASVANVVPTTALSIAVIPYNRYNGLTNSSIVIAPNPSYSGFAAATANAPYFNSNDGGGTISTTGTVFSMMLESTNIAWASSATGGGISCAGWEDNI